jgi:hypothetical protein
MHALAKGAARASGLCHHFEYLLMPPCGLMSVTAMLRQSPLTKRRFDFFGALFELH